MHLVPEHAVLWIVLSLGITSCAKPGDSSIPSTTSSLSEAKPDISAAQQLAGKINSSLPQGWTATIKDGQVIVDRSEPLQVYNGVSLAVGEQAERFPFHYRITLRLGERLSDDQYRLIKKANGPIEAKAQEDIKDTKELLYEFLRDHPEYGYQPLPWLDTGANSLYVERSFGGFLSFDSKAVQAECEHVNQIIAGLFRSYENP